MVDTVQAWPEFQKLLEIVREYGVDGDRITEYLWEQSLRGNVFNNCKCNGKSWYFVRIYIHFCDTQQHIDQIFQLTNIGSFLEVKYPKISDDVTKYLCQI